MAECRSTHKTETLETEFSIMGSEQNQAILRWNNVFRRWINVKMPRFAIWGVNALIQHMSAVPKAFWELFNSSSGATKPTPAIWVLTKIKFRRATHKPRSWRTSSAQFCSRWIMQTKTCINSNKEFIEVGNWIIFIRRQCRLLKPGRYSRISTDHV